MAKVFNPKINPYLQLMEHKGRAIVFVEGAGYYNNLLWDNYKELTDARVRLIDSFSNSITYRCCNDYYTFNDRFNASCFHIRKNSFQENILNMLRFDTEESLEIVHIDFY